MESSSDSCLRRCAARDRFGAQGIITTIIRSLFDGPFGDFFPRGWLYSLLWESFRSAGDLSNLLASFHVAYSK